MRDSRTASRKIALCAMLMALAMIFSYVEVLIPINLGVPGIKLGIANLVVVVGLFFLPAGEVLMISVARILLMGSRCTEPQTVLLFTGTSRSRCHYRNADRNPF